MQSGKTMDVEVDRLSSLPDDLIYKILSDVDILYCVRLSVLSSRWRFIWTLLPNLNFICHDAYVSSRYYEFVNNVLSVRNNTIDVSSVSVNLYDPELLSVKRILEYALSHNVQQLTIGRGFEIPTSLISSKSLKHLTIVGSGSGTTICHYHSPWDLPALTTLHINQVSLISFSSIIAMCHNLKNLTLERCYVFKREFEDSDGFTINNSRLLNLTLKKVVWNVAFLLVDTPQLKNLILVDISQQEKEQDYSRGISELSGVTISARDLTYLRIKGSYIPELFLDGFLSLEKVDLCISSPQKTDVHKVFDLFQCLHSVKSLVLSLEIVELLSTSEDVISHQQPSPFPCLKSLKIYPSLKTWKSWDLETYPLKSSLDIFRTQPDQEQEAMKIKLSAKVTKYLLDSSSNATFTMVSHEEARAIKITKAAHSLMADLWKILEGVEANVEQKKTYDDSCFEDFKMSIWPLETTEVIFCTLQNIKLLLTNVPASKRVQTQACFSRLSDKTKTVVNKVVVDMRNQCDIKQRKFSGYLDEIFLSS